MKLIVTLFLQVAAILACAGSALGGGGPVFEYPDGDDLPTSRPFFDNIDSCPISIQGEEQDDKYTYITSMLYDCYNEITSVVRNETELETLEQNENYFQHQCEKKPIIRECDAEIRSHSSKCLDSKHQLMFETTFYLLGNAFYSMCMNDGKYVAKVIREATHTTRQNALNKCLKVSSILEGIRGDIHWRNTLECFHNVKVFKGCLINILMGNDDAVNNARLIMDDMIGDMACPNYDHTRLGFCKNMVYSDELNLHRTCGVTLDKGEKMDKKIFKLGRKCLDPTGKAASKLLQFKTFQEHKNFFQTYCQKQPQIRECLADVAWKSQLCQNEDRHQQFQTFRELVESTLGAGCDEDGEMLANMVMFQKHNFSIASSNISFFLCLDTFSRKIDKSFSLNIADSSRNYIFYTDVLLAKKCFNNIVDGNKKTKDRIVSILNNIIDNDKCFHPQDDSVLLCKDLDSRKIGATKLCPIKSVDEDSKPLVSDILSLAAHCLPLLRKYNTQLMSDMPGAQVFNQASIIHCKERKLSRECLAGISSLSSSCLDTKSNMIVRAQVNALADMYRASKDILGNSLQC